MKKSLLFLCVLVALPLMSCGETQNVSSLSSSSNQDVESIVIQDPIEGGTIDLLYSAARGYLDSEKPAAYLSSASSAAGDFSDPLELRWKVTNGQGRYSLELALDEDFTDVYQTYSNLRASVKSVSVYNLVPGTYYYRIKGENIVSDVDSFTIKGSVRTINTNDGIVNMRDLGGWKTDDSHRVKYGLLYRSASWASADSVTDNMLKSLGMKTELDIRYSNASNSYSTSEHQIEGVRYLNYGMGQYCSIIPSSSKYYEKSKANLKNIFETLSDENNYPLTFHCTAGADRTGTLAFLINGLLGVDYSDLCKDFELTTFYNSKRWRSNIVDGEFDDSGIMQDDSYNYVGFGALYKEMMSGYSTSENDTLSFAIENYLKTVCEVSSQTIASVKSILTESI